MKLKLPKVTPEILAQIAANPEAWRALRELVDLVPGTIINEPVGDERPVVFLDTETTGLDHKEHHVIELGLILCSYSPSAGRLTSVDEIHTMHQQPPFPLLEEIVELTGLTDEFLARKAFDLVTLQRIFEMDPFVIAHHAKFDRPFVESDISEQWVLTRGWACSMDEVSWRNCGGLDGRSLKGLIMQAGYWFEDGHSAVRDCQGVLRLMIDIPEAFAELLAAVRLQEYRIEVPAQKVKRELNEVLKARPYRYRFEGEPRKVWWCKLPAADVAAELDWLDGKLLGAWTPVIVPWNSRTRFKANEMRMSLALDPSNFRRVDPDVIAKGDGTRSEPFDRYKAMEQIGAHEDALLEASGLLPEIFFDQQRTLGLRSHLLLYGVSGTDAFGPLGDPDFWTDQQLKNWLRYLETQVKEVVLQ